MLNRGQNKLWLEAHSYKWRISISEEVASELLFGLALNCPWNGTEFLKQVLEKGWKPSKIRKKVKKKWGENKKYYRYKMKKKHRGTCLIGVKTSCG